MIRAKDKNGVELHQFDKVTDGVCCGVVASGELLSNDEVLIFAPGTMIGCKARANMLCKIDKFTEDMLLETELSMLRVEEVV